jgi:hypothetical protein
MKTATKKIVLTAKGTINKSIVNMLSNCSYDHKTNKIHTGYYSGTGRFTTAHSAQQTLTSILDAQGYKYTIHNDAPRGGVSGEFVKVSKTAFNFIVGLITII